jgi:hypothetical protein
VVGKGIINLRANWMEKRLKYEEYAIMLNKLRPSILASFSDHNFQIR